MQKCLLSLFFVIGLNSPVLLADQIVMKNGDRVTGSIVKKDDATLTIKTDLFGVVSLAWDQVSTVTAEKPLNVVLADGKTVLGSIATVGDKVEIAAGAVKQSVVPAEIKILRDSAEQKAYERMLKPSWGDLWVVTGSIGLAGTSGNAKTATLTTPFNAVRITNHDKTTTYFNFIRSSATVGGLSSQTAQAVRGGVGYNRNLRPKLFATVFNDYEYDRFQNLDLRVVIGGGLGYSVWKSDRGSLDLVGGISWNRESFDPMRPQLPFTRNSAEFFWGNDFTYKLSGRVNFFENYRMFNNLTTTGVYRQNVDMGVSSTLSKWMTLNIAVSDRYLSNPVFGRKKNDFLYILGVGFKLAR